MKMEQQIASLIAEEEGGSASAPLPAPLPALATHFGSFPITLTKTKLFIDNVTLLEYIPGERLEDLLSSSSHFLGNFDKRNYCQQICSKHFENEAMQLEKYKSTIHAFSDEVHPVKYNRVKHGYARAFPFKALGLTNMARKVRNALIVGNYVDYDLCNAHPSLCQHLARALEITTTTLDQYIDNREGSLDAVMRHYNCNRKKAKKLFLRLSFYGCVDGWVDDEEIEGFVGVKRNLRNHLPFVKNYCNDLASITEELKRRNENLFKECAERKEAKKEKNVNGAFLGLYLQDIETRVVSSVLEFLVKNTQLCRVEHYREPFATYEFDGIKLLKALVDKYDGGVEGVLRLVNQKTLELTGLPLKWEVKDIEEGDYHHIPCLLAIPPASLPDADVLKEGVDFRVAETDAEAGDMFYNDICNRLVFGNKKVFLKKGHIWVEDSGMLKATLMQEIMHSNIYRGVNKEEKPIPFAQNRLAAERIFKNVIDTTRLNEDNTLLSKFHSTTRGRICFLDGVYDFRTKQFHDWDEFTGDNEIYSTVCIHRNYRDAHANPNETLKSKILRDIIRPIFGEKSELALQYIARAIAGHREDKNWASFYGNRDCGKGVIAKLIQTAFGEYVRPFTTGRILTSKTTEREVTAKDLYWMFGYEYCRLAIAQETPDPEVSPELAVSSAFVKKLFSGGDTFDVRRNFELEDTTIEIDFSLLVLGNHPLRINSADVKEHHLEFHSVTSFKPVEQIAIERALLMEQLNISDELPPDVLAKKMADVETVMSKYHPASSTIKDDVGTVEWANAFVSLVIDHYTPHSIVVVHEGGCDAGGGADCSSLSSAILNRLSRSDVPDDVVLSSVVKDVMKGFSFKKVRAELEAMGCSYMKWMKRSCPEYRNKYVFTNLKVIEQEQDNDNANGCILSASRM